MSYQCIRTTTLLLLTARAHSDLNPVCVRGPLCGICPLRHELDWHFASKHYDHITRCMGVTPFAEMCFSIKAIQSKPVDVDNKSIKTYSQACYRATRGIIALKHSIP